MSDKDPKPYQPTDEQIKRLLDQTKSDPRKLAIAYLRAKKRAAEAELSFRLMTDLNNASVNMLAGNPAGALNSIKNMKKKLMRQDRNLKQGEK